jgi:hypothetical protein
MGTNTLYKRLKNWGAKNTQVQKKKEYIRYTWPLVSPGNVQQIMLYHNLAYAIMAV